MVQLDAMLLPLIEKAESWAREYVSVVSIDPSEVQVTQALRGIARIKLNRSDLSLSYELVLIITVLGSNFIDFAPSMTSQFLPRNIATFVQSLSNLARRPLNHQPAVVAVSFTLPTLPLHQWN
jgi:hypothetical protein